MAIVGRGVWRFLIHSLGDPPFEFFPSLCPRTPFSNAPQEVNLYAFELAASYKALPFLSVIGDYSRHYGSANLEGLPSATDLQRDTPPESSSAKS